MKASVRILVLMAIVSLMLTACSAVFAKTGGGGTVTPITREVNFSIRDDYNIGETFPGNIDMDAAAIQAMGLDEMIFSIGWDDYEPVDNSFQWTWLDSFIAELATYGIKSRPYVCYAPEWAAPAYNMPPYDNATFYDFMYNFGNHYKANANVLSVEMWNEEDGTGFWAGTLTEFKDTMAQGVAGLRASGWTKPIIMGGLTHWAGDSATWITGFNAGTWETNYDIAAFHVYAEWTPNDSVETYMVGFKAPTAGFVYEVNNNGQGEPIWMTEDSYSTYQRPESYQASYFVRAILATLAGDGAGGEVDHYDIYQIRDEGLNEPLIGAEDMRWLGITYADGTQKAAYNACKQMVILLDGQTITTPKNGDVTVTVTAGRKSSLWKYKIDRADGAIVVGVYDRGIRSSITCNAVINSTKTTCTKYNLDGTTTAWTGTNFTGGNSINNIVLADRYAVGLFLLQ